MEKTLETVISETLTDEVRHLAKKRGAAILAHNFEAPEIQDVADAVGDALNLALAAQKMRQQTLAVCGATFVAETVKLLNQERTVLAVDAGGGVCPMAAAVRPASVREWRRTHPSGIVVCTVNSAAAIKAMSEYCVSADIAKNVICMIPKERPILFLPDMFLGWLLKASLGRENMDVWSGTCPVHSDIRLEDIQAQRRALPNAELLIHPECACTVSFSWIAGDGFVEHEHTHVLSGDGMVRFAKETEADTLIVAAESRIVHRLRKEAPNKLIVAVDDAAVCPSMERISLGTLYESLRTLQPEVSFERGTLADAALAIHRALDLVKAA